MLCTVLPCLVVLGATMYRSDAANACATGNVALF